MTISSSIIGPIIPPSIVMVIYGVTMKVSIAALFASGLVPGVLIGVALMLVAYFISVKKGFSSHGRASLKEILARLRDGLLGLMIPIIILGGISSGIFTPTEAAAVGVAYGIMTGFFVLKPSGFPIFRICFGAPPLPVPWCF